MRSKGDANHRRICGSLGAAMVIAATAVHAQQSLEYELKATYIYNFLLFVDWPAEAFQSPTAPMRVCVPDNVPFAAAVEKSMREQAGKARGRPVIVARSVAPGDVGGCHLLFVGEGTADLPEIIAPNKNTNVLTVGDSESIVRKGAIIGFFNDRNKLRIEVNPEAAARSSLKISSKLMNLAKLVSPGTSG